MNQRGFTLIELMIVVVVAGIMLAIAVPSTSSFRQSMALRQARAQLSNDLRGARQLAVTRRAPVYVRFADGSTTTNVTTYQMHLDTNNDRVIQGTETVIRRTMPSRTKIASVAMTPVDTVTFDISGILWPGQQGGRLILKNDKDKRDTLWVSAAGLTYRR